MEIILVLAIYIVITYFVVKYIRSVKMKHRNSFLAKLGKSILLAVLFGPSALISVHVIIPLPALLGLIAGVAFESVRVSSFEAVLIFIVSVVLSSAVLYWYFTVTAKVRINLGLNVDSVEKNNPKISKR